MNSIGADDLPVGWSRTTLGIVVDVLDHLRVPVNAEERSKRVGSVPYYGATGQVGWIDDHIFDEELVLLGEDGAPFLDPAKPKAYIISGKSWVNNHAHVLRAKLGLGNRFLLYQMNQADFRPFVSGTTRLKLPQAPMRRLRLVIAPEAEQKRMVAEIERQLTRLDAAVAALKRVQANLKRFRASVLKAACEGRLVATEAELSRADGRDYETGAQLLARILKERRAKWEADQRAKMQAAGKPPKDDKWKSKYQESAAPDISTLPERPEGWVWTNLEQLKTFSLYGPRFSSDAYAPRGQFVLRTSDISEDGKVDLNGTPRLPLIPDEFAKYRVQQGDLLITRTGSLGTLAVFNDTVEAIPGAYLIQYRLAAPLVTSWYAFYTLKSPAGQKRLIAGGAGVGRPNLNAPTIDEIPLPLPPIVEQSRIVAEVERRLSIMEELKTIVNANLTRADRLRQSILKRAFEGKLVPQDPNDEPAGALLERIRAERAKLDQAAKPAKGGMRRPSRRSARTEIFA